MFPKSFGWTSFNFTCRLWPPGEIREERWLQQGDFRWWQRGLWKCWWYVVDGHASLFVTEGTWQCRTQVHFTSCVVLCSLASRRERLALYAPDPLFQRNHAIMYTFKQLKHVIFTPYNLVLWHSGRFRKDKGESCNHPTAWAKLEGIFVWFRWTCTGSLQKMFSPAVARRSCESRIPEDWRQPTKRPENYPVVGYPVVGWEFFDIVFLFGML